MYADVGGLLNGLHPLHFRRIGNYEDVFKLMRYTTADVLPQIRLPGSVNSLLCARQRICGIILL